MSARPTVAGFWVACAAALVGLAAARPAGAARPCRSLSPAAALARAVQLAGEGDCDAAEPCLDRAADDADALVQVRYVLGFCAARQGDYVRAYDSFELALRVSPPEREADIREALRSTAVRAMEDEGAHPSVRCRFATLLLDESEWSATALLADGAALRVWRAACRGCADRPAALARYAAIALFEAGLGEDALRCVETARIDDDVAADMFRLKGAIHEQLGAAGDARSAYETALRHARGPQADELRTSVARTGVAAGADLRAPLAARCDSLRAVYLLPLAPRLAGYRREAERLQAGLRCPFLPTPESDSSGAGATTYYWVGGTLLVLGAAAAGTGAYFLAGPMQDELDARDAAYDRYLQVADSAESQRLAASVRSRDDAAYGNYVGGSVALGVGAGLIATGVILLAVAPDEEGRGSTAVTERRPGWQVAPSVGADGVGVQVRLPW
jgi:Flp pilus assembly protein TadD